MHCVCVCKTIIIKDCGVMNFRESGKTEEVGRGIEMGGGHRNTTWSPQKHL